MEIYLLIVTLLLSAFFSGVEIAFVSSNKLKLELKKKKDNLTGRILTELVADSSRFLGTTLIGNNIALVIYGIVMAGLLHPVLKQAIPILASYPMLLLFLQTTLSTIVVLVIGEFLPKVIFRIKPDASLSFFAFPLAVIYYLLYPLTYLVIALSKFLLRVFLRTEIEQNLPVISKIDLENFVKERVALGGEALQNTDINTALFDNVLYLNNIKIRECMVPRTEIVAIEVGESIAELTKLFTKTRLSKIIVYKESIDKILGYVHSFELLSLPANIESTIMPIPVVPESMAAKEILEQFKLERKTIAWVVDEFGGTAGILTLEDVLEEIFGEIEDEHDVGEYIMKKISDNEYMFSGRLEIDQINETFDLYIPKKDYETLGGYIIDAIENIPKTNAVVRIDQFEFTIVSATSTKIDVVKCKVVDV